MSQSLRNNLDQHSTEELLSLLKAGRVPAKVLRPLLELLIDRGVAKKDLRALVQGNGPGSRRQATDAPPSEAASARVDANVGPGDATTHPRPLPKRPPRTPAPRTEPEAFAAEPLEGGAGYEQPAHVMFLSTRGRVGRERFWKLGVPVLVVWCAGVGVAGAVLAATVSPLVGLALVLLGSWPLFNVLAQRMHDRNHSAWWIAGLCWFAPLAAAFILLASLFAVSSLSHSLLLVATVATIIAGAIGVAGWIWVGIEAGFRGTIVDGNPYAREE